MKITIFGTGYVGLVTGVCLADVGHDVLCIDIDQNKIDFLNQGKSPIYESDLETLLQKNLEQNKIAFTTDINFAVAYAPIQMIAVGTPSTPQGDADLNFVMKVADDIANHLSEDKIIISKSTVPVGTATAIQKRMQKTIQSRQKTHSVTVVSNPEFLKEGSAVNDFTRGDRIIVGTNDENAKKQLRELYSPYCRKQDKLIFMSTESSELTKYAANAMLATRISFMNEMAQIAEIYNADIEQVRLGIGSDPRIGNSFLYAGCGYGGSCFPKDVRALKHLAKKNNITSALIDSIETRNNLQKHHLKNKVLQHYANSVKNKCFAIWGLAFKPGTDDMREASSLTTIADLAKLGSTFKVFDPIASETAKKSLQDFSNVIEFCNEKYQCLEQCDALIIHTEWNEFRMPDFAKMSEKLNEKVIFDGRNLYNLELLQEMQWTYYSIGRPTILPSQ